ncbi:MAG: hypothetical protein NVS4B2_09120 [Chloroflexota bacterium]
MDVASEKRPRFGTLLRGFRLAANLTQEQLAEKALISARSISDLERGVNQSARLDTLRQLEQALDLSPGDRTLLEESARRAQRRAGTHSSASHSEQGVHTFLIADIRGYTRFTQEHGDEAAARLTSRFAGLVKETTDAVGGQLLELRGDEALVMFTSPRQAVRTAIELQHRFSVENEKDPSVPLHVGIGLDAGEAVSVADGYRSGALNLAARLCSLAGPGEIFTSEVLSHLARKTDGIAYLDRGQVRLKGLADPVRIIQALPENDVPTQLSPVVADARTELPLQSTPFVGRKRELNDISAMLQREDTRLITLTGTAGAGKTRLSLRVAENVMASFRDGVGFVSLAPVSDPELVASAIRSVLNVREIASQTPIDTVRAFLQDKHILLVLDNFEHVLPAATVVSDLLHSCRRLKIVVTSRSVLHVAAERLYAVPSLALPDKETETDAGAIAQYDAIALFVQRAQAARADFSLNADNAGAIVEICRRLDALPLAIELAAAWIRLLPPEAMLERLRDRLRLLVGGSHDLPIRQQNLRAAIDWSYSLLDPQEQTLFSALAVFVGSFTLEAVEAVCTSGADPRFDALTCLTSLVDKSLVLPSEHHNREARFLLLETLRDFALERLENSADAEALRRRHARYFLTVAEQGEPELLGPRQASWLAQFESDHDNMRATLRWCLDNDESTLGLRLANALWRFWQAHGHLAEGSRWFAHLLSAAGDDGDRAKIAVRARALMLAGAFATNQGNYDEARSLAEQSRRAYQTLDDGSGVASALNVMGNVGHFQGDYKKAEVLFTESLDLHRRFGTTRDIALSINNLASAVAELGDGERATRLFEESLSLRRTLNDRAGIAFVLRNMGEVFMARGQWDDALPPLYESLSLYRELDDRGGIALSLNSVGFALRQRGDCKGATRHYKEAFALYLDIGDKRGCADSLERLAGVAQIQERLETAAQLFGAASAVREAIGSTVSTTMRKTYEADVATTRAALGAATFQECWATGRGMSLQQIRTGPTTPA